VNLVDDHAVDVRHERVARRVVFPGRGVGLLRCHHENVRAFGAPRVQVALARDDVHRVAEFLEAVPLRLLLVGERAQRRDEQRRAAGLEGLADGEFRERGLPRTGGRRRHDVGVRLQQRGDRLALHLVELVEGERLGELWNDLGNLHQGVGRGPLG